MGIGAIFRVVLLRALQQEGHNLRRGITGLTAGRMNEGGLSSSAAIGVAYLLAYEYANALSLSPADIFGSIRRLKMGISV